jgi:hypothetical protein
MHVIFILLAMFAFGSLILGLFAPRLVLPYLSPEKRTRLRAVGIYLASTVSFFALGAAVTPKDKGDAYLDQLKAEAAVADQEYAERRADPARKAPAIVKHSPERIAANQEAVRELYVKLKAFKDDPAFHETGFGAGLPYAHQWLQRVNTLDGEMSVKNGYPPALASSAGYLRQLGMEYMRSRGGENQTTRDFRTFVEEGLAE